MTPPADVPARHDFDRYRRVGLVGNPFSAPESSGEAGPDGSWFVDRGLAPPPPPGARTMIQIIGDQGMGKSTHLAYWQRHQPGPLHYIPRRPYRDRWLPPPVGDLVYGDEIDRMPVPLRIRWFQTLARIGATVVIGSHRDVSRVARRYGFAVRTHRLQPVSGPELAQVLDRRLRAAALEDATVSVAFTATDVDEILAAGRGNLRACAAVAHRVLAERVRQADGPAIGTD